MPWAFSTCFWSQTFDVSLRNFRNELQLIYISYTSALLRKPRATQKLQFEFRVGASWRPVENYDKVFRLFLPTSSYNQALLIDFYVKKLNSLIVWFRSQQNVQFYSSSLYICYCSRTLQMDLRMIDFAHVYFEKTLDENYIEGIKSLRDWFLKLRPKTIMERTSRMTGSGKGLSWSISTCVVNFQIDQPFEKLVLVK